MVRAMAQEKEADPVISLTVKDEPLADVLDTISEETGYQFHLSPAWQSHPVSATIINLPLEKGLKRLLKSLNHTIIWESDHTIVIKVFGKSEKGSSTNAISFSQPPQPEPIPSPGDRSMDIQGLEEGNVEPNESVDQDDSGSGTNEPEEERSDLNIVSPEESE